jgi:hypothetical protein
MLRKLVLITLYLFFAACSGEQVVKIPDNVLSEDKMAQVMMDMHLMEASMNITGVNPNRIDLAGSNVPLNIDILKKNNITKKQFDDSFTFYSNNPELLSEVYQKVLNELSKMQAEVSNKK